MTNSKSEMKGRLDQIEKKEYYKVPEGYFEKLPVIIQSRATTRKKSGFENIFIPTMKYAIPSILIIVLIYVGVRPDTSQTNDFEQYFSEITTDEALDYLSETDIGTTEMVLAAVGSEEIGEILNSPTYEEEYMIEEELLFDMDWYDEESEYENI